VNENLESILKGCRRQESKSQYLLYKHFFGYGLNIAFHYTSTREEAEEVLNDAFIKVFNNILQYDFDYPFKSWLRKILVNSSIDYFRKYHKTSVELVHDEEIEESVILSIPDESDDVLPILQKLPPAYRMVFNLYVMEEYKHHEIAEILHISVGTSKSNLARAKQKLKELWLAEQKKKVKARDNG
jgi:RNA polymerase sigma factor (sigma-70 family)